MPRQFPKDIKRVVIKVGSSVIATYKMQPKTAHLRSLVNQICELQKKGLDVVLVSSGAIVLGLGELNQRQRPTDLGSLQATAALGQTVLMRLYNEFFGSQKTKCAQMLLTWDDFDARKRYINARNAFEALLDRGIVPIVNENDTVSTDEIKFGDNDRLSALVASLIGADLLVILSDVDGLYDLSQSDKKLLQEIQSITKEIESLAGGTKKRNMSKGGMTAKLQAVKIALESKIPCIIAHGETDEVIRRIMKKERIGTYFVEKEEKLIARKHWISFGAKPKGILIVDDGAKKALLRGGTSLLLPGVSAWKGTFKKGDVVVVCDNAEVEFARGKVNYSSNDLESIQDKKRKVEAIHVDDLVLSER